MALELKLEGKRPVGAWWMDQQVPGTAHETYLSLMHRLSVLKILCCSCYI